MMLVGFVDVNKAEEAEAEVEAEENKEEELENEDMCEDVNMDMDAGDVEMDCCIPDNVDTGEALLTAFDDAEVDVGDDDDDDRGE